MDAIDVLGWLNLFVIAISVEVEIVRFGLRMLLAQI